MIANHKGEVPFVILIIPYLLGLGTGLNFLSAAWATPLAIIFVLLSSTFITLNLVYKRFNIYKIRWTGGLLINLILFVFGCISVSAYSELNSKNYFAKFPARYLVVKVDNGPALKNGYLRFTAQVLENVNNGKAFAVSGTLLISIKDNTEDTISYGDELLIPADYAPIDPPFNPAEFNYKSYLADKNIYNQSFLYPGQYTVPAHNKGNALIAFSLRLRQKLVNKLNANIHDHDAAAVASALLLGYKADLGDDVRQAYAKTGTMYVLNIAGAQVAVIYYLLSIIFGFLTRHKYGKPVRAILIISLVWGYALLTGLAPPVCRAATIISMAIIGKTYNRYINTLNLLAVSAFILLLFDPFLIADVGFQLAYLAISGLIIFRPVVYKWLKFKNKWADRVWALCSVSIAAQALTFPLSAFYFHQFPVYFLLSNLLVFVPVTIIMYAGILYLLLPKLSFVSKALGYLLEKTILWMNHILAAIGNARYASIGKIWIDTSEYLLLYAVIISLFCFLYYKRSWLLTLGLSCIFLLSASFSYKNISALKSGSIVFLNLRKHTGIVMRHGRSAVVITDLDDTDKNYKYSVQPYLDSSKINKVGLYHPGQDISTAFVVKRGALIQFGSKKILLYDRMFSLDKKIAVDYIYVTGNPYTSISAINKNFTYGMLVMDGSNSDRLIGSLRQQAEEMRINYAVLKRNKSLFAVSN